MQRCMRYSNQAAPYAESAYTERKVTKALQCRTRHFSHVDGDNGGERLGRRLQLLWVLHPQREHLRQASSLSGRLFAHGLLRADVSYVAFSHSPQTVQAHSYS